MIFSKAKNRIDELNVKYKLKLNSLVSVDNIFDTYFQKAKSTENLRQRSLMLLVLCESEASLTDREMYLDEYIKTNRELWQTKI